MWTVDPEDVAEGDRIFESHAAWMTGHSREGDTALLSYKIAKGPELSNPVDPNSEPTGNTIFVLNEIYEAPAGVAEHWRLSVLYYGGLPRPFRGAGLHHQPPNWQLPLACSCAPGAGPPPHRPQGAGVVS